MLLVKLRKVIVSTITVDLKYLLLGAFRKIRKYIKVTQDQVFSQTKITTAAKTPTFSLLGFQTRIPGYQSFHFENYKIYYLRMYEG
jgi:hypothetical protein